MRQTGGLTGKRESWQVCLGIFNHLCNLLEEACYELDLQLAAMEDAAGLGGAFFQQYAAALKQLKEQHAAVTQKAIFLTQLATYLSITIPAPQQSQIVQQV